MKKYISLIILVLSLFGCQQNKVVDGIPGSSISILINSLTNDGYLVQKFDSTLIDNKIESYEYEFINDDVQYGVLFHLGENNTSKIWSFRATNIDNDSIKTLDFFIAIASFNYKDSNPDKVKNWLIANFDNSDSEITVGNVHFQINVESENKRWLFVEQVQSVR